MKQILCRVCINFDELTSLTPLAMRDKGKRSNYLISTSARRFLCNGKTLSSFIHEESTLFPNDLTCQYAVVDIAMAKVIAAEVIISRDVMQMENSSFSIV